MASSYPTGLDAFTTGTLTGIVSGTDHGNKGDALNKIEAELGTDPSGASSTVKARIEAVEAGGLMFADGDAATPGLRFGSDTNSGIARLGTDRMAFVTAGVIRAYVQSDGCLIVPDAAAGDPTNLTSGTAPGTIVSGRNRAFRSINNAQTGTIRMLTSNSSDEISIGSEGAEGGPPTSLIMRNTGEFQFVGVTASLAVMGLTAASSTVFVTKQIGDSVPRIAMLGTGRTEYSSGAAAADVVIIPRNNAGQWRLAAGYMTLDDATAGALIEFAPRSATGVPNNSLFVNSTGGKLSFKDGSAVVNALY